MRDPVLEAFHTRVAPGIRALHEHRLALRARTKWEGVVVAAASLLAAVFLARVPSNGDGLGILGPIAGAIWMGWRLNSMQKGWASRVVDTVMPVLCEAMGRAEYRERGIDPAVLKPFEELGVIPRSVRQELQHHLKGWEGGTEFEVLAADLWQGASGGGGRSSARNVFHGLLFRLQLPIRVPTHVVVRPRPIGIPAALAGVFESRLMASLHEVDVGPGDFSTRFEVRAALRDPFTADQVRALLSPRVQQALLELNAAEGGLIGDRPAFTAAFQDDRLLLALSRYGKSKVGGVAFERTRPFLDAGIYLMGDEAELARRLDALLQDARIGHRMVQRLGLAAG
jgi:hypothetical protein